MLRVTRPVCDRALLVCEIRPSLIYCMATFTHEGAGGGSLLIPPSLPHFPLHPGEGLPALVERRDSHMSFDCIMAQLPVGGEGGAGAMQSGLLASSFQGRSCSKQRAKNTRPRDECPE